MRQSREDRGSETDLQKLSDGLKAFSSPITLYLEESWFCLEKLPSKSRSTEAENTAVLVELLVMVKSSLLCSQDIVIEPLVFL